MENVVYYKPTNRDEKHYSWNDLGDTFTIDKQGHCVKCAHSSYYYRDGLNIISEKYYDEKLLIDKKHVRFLTPFFTDVSNLFNIIPNSKYIREVILPQSNIDFEITTDDNICQVNMIILGKRYDTSSLDTIKYFVEKGADIHKNKKILNWCASRGLLDIMKYLVELGLDIHHKQEQALEYAIAGENMDIIEYLIDHGADVHADNEKAIRCAASTGNYSIFRYLVEKGANIHIIQNNPLIAACECGSIDIIKYLIDHKVDIHSENDLALQMAALRGHFDVVKLLIDSGANIHANEDAALQNSLKCEHDSVVKITFGENNDDSSGTKTPNHQEVTKLLLEKGANPNVNEEYPLKLATLNGDLNMIQLLIKYGANISCAKGIIWDSIWSGDMKVVEYVVDHGADIHEDDGYAIVCSSILNRLDMLQFFYEKGARNNEALQQSVNMGHFDIVRFLVEHCAHIDMSIIETCEDANIREYLKKNLKKIEFPNI